MKTCKKCGDKKSIDLFYPVPKNRDGHDGTCKSCTLAIGKDRRRNNPEHAAVLHVRYRSANPEKVSATNARWRAANPEMISAAWNRWRSANPEKIAATKAKWSSGNRGKLNFYKSERRAAQRNAMPSWANNFFISEIYDLAVRRSDVTGFKWHVDHIVPLVSKVVCGLHVEGNLQVIPAVENFKKNNKHWPDMWQQPA